jgi:flagellar operon protein
LSISEIYRGIVTVPGVEPVQPGSHKGIAKPEKPNGPSEFQEIFEKESKSLNLSQHAETRIRSREIPWSEALEQRISQGIDQASSKGSRETLIIADNVAVIANVKSRTVVTAMDKSQLKERVFTNIDSAVLV